MSSYDKDKIKKTLIKKYKTKLKPSVLEANIDGLVNEYIENQSFIKKNNLTVKDLPTPEVVNSWFEDELNDEDLYESLKNDDPWMKVDLLKIYQKDKLAKEVFKNLYDLKWSVDVEVEKHIEMMIKLLKLADRPSTTQINRDIIINRLINIALLGTIRFYHFERHPYLKESQVSQAIKYFFKVLSLINSIKNGKYKDKKIPGEIYIFKSLDTATNQDLLDKEADIEEDDDES